MILEIVQDFGDTTDDFYGVKRVSGKSSGLIFSHLKKNWIE